MNLRKDIENTSDYKIEISQEVLADVDEILFWYKLHSEELSKEFYKHLLFGLSNILSNPKGYQQIFKNVRRYIVKKFPYSIVYKLYKRKSLIVIVSVNHNSRNPKIWKKRMN